MATAYFSQNVTGVEPGVAFLEGVAQDGFFRGFFLGVALKRPLFCDFTDEQARVAFCNFLHGALVIPDRVAGAIVELHQFVRRCGHANGIVQIEEIAEADVALAGSVELRDGLNTKTLFELLPDGGAQSIAKHFCQAVVAILFTWRLVQ